MVKRTLKKSASGLARLGEFGLISRLERRLGHRSPRTLVGIGDDCALFRVSPGHELAASCDALVEGVHFDLNFTSPSDLGRKTIAVNLSDMAAMGATPQWALISLGIPRNTSVSFLDRLYGGIDRICREYKVELAGGDTVKSPGGLLLNVTMLGEVPAGRWFVRSGARAGDLIFVTGTLGDSALGLKILQSQGELKGTARDRKYLVQRHLNPTPRIAEARILSGLASGMGAMIDVSDGLLQDLGHICRASGVGAELEDGTLPKSQPFDKYENKYGSPIRDLAFCGGEDYELLFTIRPDNAKKLISRFHKAGKRLTQIGRVTGDRGCIVRIDPEGKRTPVRKPGGYNHFS